MSDEIKQRLQESTADCIKCYEAWEKDKKNSDSREALNNAVHEMRKVASRLEIDLAVSERDEMASKPIPIPPHRDARGRHQGGDDNAGNRAEGGNKGGAKQQRSRSRKPAPKKASEG